MNHKAIEQDSNTTTAEMEPHMPVSRTDVSDEILETVVGGLAHGGLAHPYQAPHQPTLQTTPNPVYTIQSSIPQ